MTKTLDLLTNNIPNQQTCSEQTKFKITILPTFPFLRISEPTRRNAISGACHAQLKLPERKGTPVTSPGVLHAYLQRLMEKKDTSGATISSTPLADSSTRRPDAWCISMVGELMVGIGYLE